ncbi:hypothetical protein [Candidatus Palauibacter sp.]|uniref:hypothetical protein n=1 Tax=Candidatus Palauibacter sp. TaxID=3101350 RepID=UPI003B595E1E
MIYRTPARKSMQFPVVFPVAVAASVFGASGCQQEDRQEPEPLPQANVAGVAVARGDHSLRTEALLAAPDTTADSDWLSVTTDMRYDVDLDVLFLMDMFNASLVEIDTLGSLLSMYGGTKGRGPAEIGELVDFAFSSEWVLLLDRPNRKVMVYPRRKPMLDVFPLSSVYRSIALREDGIILLAPGADSSAVDLYTFAGERVGGIGRTEDLPVRCQSTDGCVRDRRLCMGCKVREAGGVVYIHNEEDNMASILDGVGGAELIDLQERIPQLGQWVLMDEPYMRAAQDAARERSSARVVVVAFKRYLTNVHALADGRVAFSVNPARPIYSRTGYQYWLVDLETFEVETIMFTNPAQGRLATGWPTVYAVNRDDYGIYRLVSCGNGR